ncbi:hypothetical protein DPMN_029257 [Dreissena polymorpha]|uniref:Uncharacterized protein n=1 Tax=Dreissena polymorpha TaxID=45954 RepID=A0A9D4LXU2_DREPO|nr:hypothetical protein DPMN_029257 [Dreissena polymorpha]
MARSHFSNKRKTAPPPDGQVFQRTGTMFELYPDIIRTNVLNTFHEEWTISTTASVKTMFCYSHIRKTASTPGGNVEVIDLKSNERLSNQHAI